MNLMARKEYIFSLAKQSLNNQMASVTVELLNRFFIIIFKVIEKILLLIEIEKYG